MPDDDLPSFLLYHYAEPNKERPENELGEREWTLITPPPDASSATQEASFRTELKEFGLRITKTYTLAKGDYHVGLSVKLERIPGTTVLPFRYSLSTGRGLPIEGVWYTSVYRNCYIGWFEGDAARRHLDDSASINLNAGGERMVRSGGMEFQYAAVANQFFASALCVDDRQDKRNFVEFVRATAEGNYPPDKPMLGDITARMISEELSVTDKPIEHKYLLYHGPVKVRLLHQMRGAQAVSEELIDRYETGLNLRTMTDYHSDNWLGRFADTIGWTWLTIKTTNLMHGLLGFLLQYLPAPLAILLVTVIVRGALHPLSRRQQLNTLKFQERMKQHEPALKRLEEQYKGRDPNEFQQAKLKYMMQNGLNPMSQLGGCLLIFLQMPIFMGLYYCLQENVFFRLNPLIPGFFWMKNLAAPDMLFWWTDKIPFISTPESLGSPLYLGPYFNLLPVIAAGFMFMQQKLMSPTPTDEQQRMQQSMFKYMMIVMVIMFYKVASGLALYFIASSIWGLVERKVIPKPKLKESPVSAASNNGKGKSLPAKQKPDGLIGRLREQLGDAWKRLLEAAEKK